MKYLIKAKVKIKDVFNIISKEIEAHSKSLAQEKFKAKLGADHKLKRSKIEILEIKELN